MRQDSLFLSKDELRQFTGTAHRKLMCEYLDKRNIRYEMNRKLEIIVLRESVESFILRDSEWRRSIGKRREKKLHL